MEDLAKACSKTKGPFRSAEGPGVFASMGQHLNQPRSRVEKPAEPEVIHADPDDPEAPVVEVISEGDRVRRIRVTYAQGTRQLDLELDCEGS